MYYAKINFKFENLLNHYLILAILAFGLLSNIVVAQDFKGSDGFMYRVINGTENVELIQRPYSQGGFYSQATCTINEKITHSGNTYTVIGIGEKAFEKSSNVKQIILPETITYIKKEAFVSSGITSIVIPKLVENIGESVFKNCKKLKSIVVDQENKDYKSIDDVLYNKAVTELLHYPFDREKNYYLIPKTLTGINERPFDGVNLKSFIALFDDPSKVNANKESFYINWDSDNYKVTLYVPKGKTAAYEIWKGAEEWENNINKIEEISLSFDKNSIEMGQGGSETISATVSPNFVNLPITWESDNASVVITNNNNNTATVSLTGTQGATVSAKIGGVTYAQCVITASQKFIKNNICYEISGTNVKVVANENKNYSGNIEIPASVENEGTTYNVTEIAENAFTNCVSLTSVSFPNSISKIANNVFDGCSTLTEIKTVGNPYYKTIDGVLFDASQNNLLLYPSAKVNTHYEIPAGTTTVGEKAFINCNNLKSIVIPKSITNLKSYFLHNCKSLAQVISYAKASEINLGNNAFVGINALAKLYAFENYKAEYENINTWNDNFQINAITINIDENKNLVINETRKINLQFNPKEVTGLNVTWNSENNSFVSLNTTNGEVTGTVLGTENVSALLENSTTKVNCEVKVANSFIENNIRYAMLSNNAVRVIANDTEKYKNEINIPATVEHETKTYTVEEISETAFENCNQLTAINVNEANANYKSIDGVLFSKDNNVLIKYPAARTNENYIVPANVKTINNFAFENNTKLKNITLPASLTTIQGVIFNNCTSLLNINVENDNNNFSSSNGILFNKTKNILIKYPAAKTENNFIIPNSVREIKNKAFSNCSNLNTVALPNGMTNINDVYFVSCNLLNTIVLSESISTIECDFSSSCNITKIVSYITNVATVKVLNNALANYNSATLFVPQGTSDSYSSADNWKNITQISEIKINIQPNSYTIKYPNNYQLTANIIPAEAIGLNILWESDDENLITVNENNGLISSLPKTGNANVIAKIKNIASAKCQINVEVPITGIIISPETKTLDIAATKTLQMSATLQPENISTTDVTWESSDNTKATVDENGLVTFKEAGTIEITVTTKDKKHNSKATLTINDTRKRVTGVTLNSNSEKFVGKHTFNLIANVKPYDATDRTVTWHSTDNTIAEVDDEGHVNIKGKKGTVDIIVTTNDGNYTETCTFIVYEKNVNIVTTGVTLNKNKATVKIGTTLQLTETIIPSNATNKNVTWKSDDDDIAIVDEKGLVTAVNLGTTTITVKTVSGKHKAKCIITVTDKDTGIENLFTSDNKYNVYPTSVVNKFTIKSTKELKSPIMLEIYNISGEKVYADKITNKVQTINIANLKSGIYLLKIENEVIKVVKL